MSDAHHSRLKNLLPCCHDAIYSTLIHRDVQETSNILVYFLTVRTSRQDMHSGTTLLELPGQMGARCRPWRPPPPGSENRFIPLPPTRNG
ncbi:uncharacterized protein LACBIDRAFT_313936 [Laccaria bicolor S238N-H82]|uniref:Predicted protein n=1 Tax=Laccaria bicolor (strain S238N-H82 / ATCC MYA-4686) TaxID=486041 RepID=B0D169_LACBS|nr:uncharacterized protein LACBIDRAFT_313936 [Laccaria bicolor S238N-H82]EDR11948.1 predicted protein [Laccaria bicolor S238N-H82]|eukprot:XP_001877845.1 predicted protein [Laccaria bicolor S238N-H82]